MGIFLSAHSDEILLAHLGPDHVQLTLLNWDTKSVLTLNKN